MLYTPHNIEQKTGKSGKGYQVASLEDVNGQRFDGVSSFGDFIEGKQLEGTIVQNGTFLNFKATAQVQSGGKTAQIERVMDKKQDAILFSQDRKNDAIQHAGAITNATNLVVAMLKANMIPTTITQEEVQVKSKIREFIIFYQQLYKNPDSINPAASDAPPF